MLVAKARKKSRSSFDVVCIGAGPAGLTAAYVLSKQGKKVLVLEGDPTYVGGISRTVQYKGFRFDVGGHRFFTKSKPVQALWNELLPKGMLVRKRKSRIYYRGKFFSYPLKPAEALFNLGILESAICMLSYAKAKLFPVPNPKSFEDWVCNQFGRRLFQIFFKTYTEKVWGMDCKEISADWAAQRIKGLSLGKAVWNALASLLPFRGANRVKTLIESFHYPKEGPGMMWEAAAKLTAEHGGEIRMGCRVTALEMEEDGPQKVTYHDGEGKNVTVTCDHVLSSAPLREVISMLDPKPRCSARVQQLRYRDFLTVALIVKDNERFDDNWLYIHDPGVKVGRIQNFKSWSPHLVPVKGQACLGLEYFCFEGDGLWEASDESLIRLARKEVERLGLIAAEDFVEGTVVRQPKAYPVYDGIYSGILEEVRAELEGRFPQLHLVGRNGMHKYNNQDHSMMTALLTAENIAAGTRRFDPWAVNEDAEYHEEGESTSKGASGLRLVPMPVESPAEAPAARVPIMSDYSRRRKLKILEEYAPTEARILEVGSGAGWMSDRLTEMGHEVTRVDLVPGPGTVVGDIRKWKSMGLKADTYDVVVAMELIEHVDCLDDLVALCKPGGLIFLSSPAPKWDWAMKILEAIGLNQKRTSPHDHLVDFTTIPLEPVMVRRQLGIHQLGLFRKAVPPAKALRRRA